LRRGSELTAECFLYDTLPNGAGYAKEIHDDIETLLRAALSLAESCPMDCPRACYSCLLDYRNQWEHALLDRTLARDLLRFITDGLLPDISSDVAVEALKHLAAFAAESRAVDIRPSGVPNCTSHIAAVEVAENRRVAVVPIHPTRTLDTIESEAIARIHDAAVVPATTFDLQVRPFWVWRNVTSPLEPPQ
jgi:hypothetical protein